MNVAILEELCGIEACNTPQSGHTFSSTTKPTTNITRMDTASTTDPDSDTISHPSQLSAETIFSNLDVKYYLLELHFCNPCTMPQILTILSHKH